MGDGGRWEAGGRLYHPLVKRQSRCVFNEAQKQLQCTCQTKMVIGSSLTPHSLISAPLGG